MAKEVIVELTKDEGNLPAGSRFGLESAARAKRVYPSARIVSYVDGSEYIEPSKREVKGDDGADTPKDSA